MHIFHTKYDRVKEYVQQFSDWIPYEHRVVAKARDIAGQAKFVPMPPNQQTVGIGTIECVQTWKAVLVFLVFICVATQLKKVSEDLKVFRYYCGDMYLLVL